jgi:hypothetical protein
MKKLSIVVLVVLSLTFAGLAEAAKPQKKTRNANRFGAYGALLVGKARYTGDQSSFEAGLVDVFNTARSPTRNVSVSSKTDDIGYQATFGFRFNRYFAAELGLAQYGELSSTVRGEVDQGTGFLPANVKLAFNVGGPVFSAVGILPLGKKVDIYARAGYLFASSAREFSAHVDGDLAVANNARGDSQVPVYAAGFSYHINQVYSIRAEYQKIDRVGEKNRTGTEDLNVIGIGFVMRF